jgi:hypothetical protein
MIYRTFIFILIYLQYNTVEGHTWFISNTYCTVHRPANNYIYAFIYCTHSHKVHKGCDR